MADEVLVRQLLEEVSDSRCTPEEACREHPELLSEVRRRWQRLRAFEAHVEQLFPSPGPEQRAAAPGSTPAPSGELPQIPGYLVESVLGRGGIGIVYRARHVRLGRHVALKMLLAGEFASRDQLDRFRREAEVVAGLRHPGIVQVFDVGDHEGRPWFTMELIEGGSLAQDLDGKPQPGRRAAGVVASLAQAMQAAHDRGVVHRDIKPANVLLDAGGVARLSDFGLARRLEGGSKLTLAGSPMGTPSYMAPEQALGKEDLIGPATDVYALGALLYEMLTGRPPFQGETAAETERQVVTQEPVRPSRLNSKVPRDLETICLKCLSKDPARRYASAADLAEDLRRYEHGEAIRARPASAAEHVLHWVRRKPAAAALILTILALLGLAAVMGVNAWRSESKRREDIATWNPRLGLVHELQANGRYREARELLQNSTATDVGELGQRIRSAFGDLDLAQRLQDIRSDRASLVDGGLDDASIRAKADRGYADALGAAGLSDLQVPPAVVADRIRASPVHRAIVAALDDWTLCASDDARLRWIFEVARLADPDPAGWRDRVRTPDLSRDELAGLAEEAVVKDHSVQLLMALGQRVAAAGVDPVAFLERVQEQYPGDFWTCYSLANALWDRQPSESIRYYQAALASQPDNAVAHHSVGRALANVERTAEAIDHFREAVRLEPTFAEAIGDLGMALADRGELDEALELAQRAVALDGTSPRNHGGLGYVFKSQGRKDEAMASFRESIALDPDFVWGHFNLALLLEEAGRFDEAMEHLERARRVEPNSGWLSVGIARLLMRQQRYDESIEVLEATTKLDSKMWRAGAHKLLGDCWRAKQSPERALLEYSTSLALNPDSEPVARSRRSVMVQVGLGQAAWAEWEHALKSAPAEHTAWSGFAELSLLLDHPDAYAWACGELLDRFEASDDPQVCERVGRSCLVGALGPAETERAAAAIERALASEQAPDWTRPYFQVAQGLARYRLGDFDGAVGALQGEASRVLGPLPHLVLSMSHQRAGRPGEAVRSLATALRVHDWNPATTEGPDAWIFLILRGEAESLVLPDLAAWLEGQGGPADQGARLALVAACESRQLTARAASLYSEAFAAEPELANRLETGLRHRAACCAAQAGMGRGEDADQLGEAERESLRAQARAWLCDDLAAWRSLLAGSSPAQREQLPTRLQSLFESPALGCVRDEVELGKLPDAERQAWLALWRDVEALLDEARSAGS